MKTRIRAGSHLEVARLLAPAGEAGLRVRDLDLTATARCREVVATGPAGTVYLCHPFLVHAAQINRGTLPKFMAQPPLLPISSGEQGVGDMDESSPVKAAIRRGLSCGRPGQTHLKVLWCEG